MWSTTQQEEGDIVLVGTLDGHNTHLPRPPLLLPRPPTMMTMTKKRKTNISSSQRPNKVRDP
jgi:hypothetical protein